MGEPTHHLDVAAIEQLETALADFDGTILVVRHDETFLERIVVSRVLVVAAGTVEECQPSSPRTPSG